MIEGPEAPIGVLHALEQRRDAAAHGTATGCASKPALQAKCHGLQGLRFSAPSCVIGVVQGTPCQLQCRGCLRASVHPNQVNYSTPVRTWNRPHSSRHSLMLAPKKCNTTVCADRALPSIYRTTQLHAQYNHPSTQHIRTDHASQIFCADITGLGSRLRRLRSVIESATALCVRTM